MSYYFGWNYWKAHTRDDYWNLGGYWNKPNKGIFVGTRRADHVTFDTSISSIKTRGGDDTVTTNASVDTIRLGSGDDTLVANGPIKQIFAGRGNDEVEVNGASGTIRMGWGDDDLTLSDLVDAANGGRGYDTLSFNFEAGQVDIEVQGNKVILMDRISGEDMVVRGFEKFEFADRSFSRSDIDTFFGEDAVAPYLQVAGGTQILTVNDTDPSVSVLWDRVVQLAVIENEGPNGPTIASRAYAMMHTAMYDAWSAYDATATHVSFDIEGDNLKVLGDFEDKMKAMSYAALTVLREIFPEQEDLYRELMEERLGLDMEDDGSQAAMIGIDAAEDLLALRINDGANQANGYTDTTGYTPFNPHPGEINDITRWTPENVPLDPEDSNPEQNFLTPHWLNVESFALPETATGETDFAPTLPAAPQPFFTQAFSGSTLDFAAKEITLDAPVTIDGIDYVAGDTIAVSQALIGLVINPEFISQAERVIEISAGLTDEQKIIAEFWEDGGGTAFPPGTFMAFAQFVSARDNHDIDTDAKMFLAMANAVMDAGIATWQAKVEYDYARPVRMIRDLGELGLIGELGVDENTGEAGYVIEAFGGFNEDGTGRGTQTILATNFITFQRPGADPSPPFAEYTSGHSAFSSAGAEVLRLFTGSDAFGGSVTFAPDSIQFESGVPSSEVTLAWDTFTSAADEAGFSRLYGGIHFDEGDLNGRQLGRDIGDLAFDMAMRFIDGTATDMDRPFYGDAFILS